MAGSDHDCGPTGPESGDPPDGGAAAPSDGPPDPDTFPAVPLPGVGPGVDPEDTVAWKPPVQDGRGPSDTQPPVPEGPSDDDDEAVAGGIWIAIVAAPVVGAIAAMILASNLDGMPADEANARASFWGPVIGTAVAATAAAAFVGRRTSRAFAAGLGLFLLGACGTVGAGYAAMVDAVAPWQAYTPPPATATDPSPTPTAAEQEPTREQEPADADVEPGSAVAQQLYVGYVRDNVHELSGESDEALLEIGTWICGLQDGGMTTQEILDELIATNDGTFEADDFGRTIAAADRWLC